MELQITDAVLNAFKKINAGAEHNECVNIVAKELHNAGLQCVKEKPLMCGGNLCKPDITIVDQIGKNLAHIEVKCKEKFDQGDLEQAEKYYKADKVPVYLVNLKGDKPVPNIRKFTGEWSVV